jgi:hypothetical protein
LGGERRQAAQDLFQEKFSNGRSMAEKWLATTRRCDGVGTTDARNVLGQSHYLLGKNKRMGASVFGEQPCIPSSENDPHIEKVDMWGGHPY